MERTFVILKPDTVRRRLVSAVLSRYETKGFNIVAMEQRHIDAEMAAKHYFEHVEKPFYPEMRDYITSGPLVALVLEAENAIEIVRLMNGATNGAKAAPGTIRGDFTLGFTENVVHASDSPESAAREIALWFPDLAD